MDACAVGRGVSKGLLDAWDSRRGRGEIFRKGLPDLSGFREWLGM